MSLAARICILIITVILCISVPVAVNNLKPPCFIIVISQELCSA